MEWDGLAAVSARLLFLARRPSSHPSFDSSEESCQSRSPSKLAWAHRIRSRRGKLAQPTPSPDDAAQTNAVPVVSRWTVWSFSHHHPLVLLAARASHSERPPVPTLHLPSILDASSTARTHDVRTPFASRVGTWNHRPPCPQWQGLPLAPDIVDPPAFRSAQNHTLGHCRVRNACCRTSHYTLHSHVWMDGRCCMHLLEIPCTPHWDPKAGAPRFVEACICTSSELAS